MDAETVSVAANSIMAAGIVLVYWQARTMARQLTADHERSRRQAAVDMLRLWDERLSRKGSTSRKLVEKLTFDQAKLLFKQEPFFLSAVHKSLLLAAIPDCSPLASQSHDGAMIEVPEAECAAIRWEVVTYLNSLETVLSAWQHNIADRQMIEEQFEYLVRPEDGHYLLREFRNAAGGSNAFPCIDAFVRHLEEKRKHNGKPPIA